MHTRLVVPLCVALALLSACGSSSEDETGAREVAMGEGQRFVPPTLEVTPGEITFTNDSSEAHTVTAYEDSLPDGADFFSSGGLSDEEAARGDVAAALIKSGEEFSVTLTEPGTYTYFCIPHESQGMTGTIVVRAAGG